MSLTSRTIKCRLRNGSTAHIRCRAVHTRHQRRPHSRKCCMDLPLRQLRRMRSPRLQSFQGQLQSYQSHLRIRMRLQACATAFMRRSVCSAHALVARRMFSPLLCLLRPSCLPRFRSVSFSEFCARLHHLAHLSPQLRHLSCNLHLRNLRAYSHRIRNANHC